MTTRIPRRVGVLVAVLALLLAGTVAPAAGSARASGDAPAGASAHPAAAAFAEAKLADLAHVARQRGISLDQAVEQVGWQESFAAFVDDLARRYPGRYAGSGITAGGTGAWIAFKGQPPGAAAAGAPAFPVTVDLVTGTGFSEQELVESLERSYFAILERPDVADAAGGYDARTGEITIRVEPQRPVGASARTRLAATLEAAGHVANPAITLAVQVVDQVEARLDSSDMRGGGYLQPSTSAYCTAGFTVRRDSDGARGIATARHCADSWSSLRYYNHGTSAYTTVQRRGLAAPSWGDLAWYSEGSYTARPWFYADYGTARTVWSVGNPVQGLTLCKFGRTTGQTCDEVYRVNECSSGYCGLVAMRNRRAAGGDSGGPYFMGNTAYGIHHGAKSIWLSMRDLFSRAANLPNALGVRVLQPDSTGSSKGGFQSCGSERVAIRSVANGNVGHSIYGQTLGTWNNGSAYLTRVTESTFNSGQWYAWTDQEMVLADTYAYCVW